MVTLTISGLKQDLSNGLTRPQLSEKYNLPITQVAKAIKQAGLSGKRAIAKKFELIDDETTAENIVAAGYSKQQASDILNND